MSIPHRSDPLSNANTVEPVLKDHPIDHKNVVSEDRWSVMTGSITLKCGTFCQEYLVFQDGWSFIRVVIKMWSLKTGGLG